MGGFHTHAAQTAEFVALYGNPAFDAEAKTLPISTFEPMLHIPSLQDQVSPGQIRAIEL